MKRPLLIALIGLNLALLGAILLSWWQIDPRWQPPAPQQPELASLAGQTLAFPRAPLVELVQTLERPLFMNTRRPPPVEELVVEATPVPAVADALDQVELLGLFGQGATPFLMLKSEGKVLRMKEGDVLGEWTLRTIEERSARFMRGSERRTLELKHAQAPAARPVSAAQRLRDAVSTLAAEETEAEEAVQEEGEAP